MIGRSGVLASRYGWVMVFVVFLLTGLSFGALASISVFLKPLAADFGWGRGQTAFGYTAIAFSSALFGVVWGIVADRFGARYFGIVGAVVMTIALLGLSSQETLLEFYAFYFLFGAFGNAIVGSPLYADVGFWFEKNAGLALGVTAAGGAFGQGVVPLLVGIFIEEVGWRATYAGMAWVYLALALPVAFLIRESPRRTIARQNPTAEPHDFVLSEKEVMLWIGAAVVFCCNCMAVPIVHLVPLLTDQGFELSAAARVLMVLMMAGVLGRIFGGQLGDRIGPIKAYMVMSAGQAIFVVWFPWLEHPLAIYLVALAFGFTYSGVMSSILVCTRAMVSPGFAARAMSITTFAGWFGMGLGGFLGGAFFDWSGGYLISYSYAGVMGFINLLVLVAFYRRVRDQESLAAAAAAV